jgi:hypothetical protein
MTRIAARATSFNSNNDYVGSGTNGIKSSDVSYVFYNHTTNTIDRYNEPIATANGVRVARESDHPITTPVFVTPLMNLLGLTTAGTQKVNVSAVATITTVPAIPITIWSTVCGANGVQVNDVVLKVQHPSKKQDDGSENSCWTTFRLFVGCGRY